MLILKTFNSGINEGKSRYYFQVSPYSQTLSGMMMTKVQLLDKAFEEPVHKKRWKNLSPKESRSIRYLTVKQS